MENIPGASWGLDSTEPGGEPGAAVGLQSIAIVEAGWLFLCYNILVILFLRTNAWTGKIILKDGFSYWLWAIVVLFKPFVSIYRPTKKCEFKFIKFEEENLEITEISYCNFVTVVA